MDMTFDSIWEQEERQGLQQRLRQDYPSWLRRRRQRSTALATVAMLMVAGIAVFNIQYPSSKNYDGIACNRSGIPSDHWAAVASDILTIEMI